MKNSKKSSFNFLDKKTSFLFALAILIRLVLMPITLHPDLLGHSFSAYFLAYEGRLNLYDTLANLPSDHPLVKNFGVSDIFIYPPLAYYSLGFFRILTKTFTDPNFIPWLMENLDKIHSYPKLLQHLFWFKLPYLFFDIFLAFLLAELFEERKKKKTAFLLWLFNPLTLYATFMVGQLDLLPTFFTVLSLFFLKKGKVKSSVFTIGLAASYKMYPLFLLLPLVFFISDNFWRRVKLILVGIFPFLFFIAPYINSSAFRAMVFSPKSQKMLFMGWPVSGAEVVYPFIVGLTLIYLYAYYSKVKINPASYFLAILLLTLSVTHYHPQWFLWITPFLIWELVENDFQNIFLTTILFFSWLFLTLLFEPSLSYGLFNPIWPKLEKIIALSEVVNRYTNIFQFKSILRSVFAGASMFLVFKLFKERRNNV